MGHRLTCPELTEDGELLIGAASALGIRRPARLDLLLHPSHPDAEPEPSAREGIEGSDALRQGHRVMVGKDQHPCRRADRAGQPGGKGQQLQGIGDITQSVQPHLAGRVVRVPAPGERARPTLSQLSAAATAPGGRAPTAGD